MLRFRSSVLRWRAWRFASTMMPRAFSPTGTAAIDRTCGSALRSAIVLVEHRAVVDAGDGDDLGVDLHADPAQPLQVGQDIGRVAQDARPHGRVGGVDRDVERAQALLLDAPPVVLAQVGERDEVAEQERVAVVVILDVERAAQARRHLLDEAEWAVVGAAADRPVEGHLGEGDARAARRRSARETSTRRRRAGRAG